ncbi:hypothetical protein PUN28_000657 [Cardiocondyla obscurior]|uniref:Uncharacterized protein n=1 Tax=Cardiocondyla obscurior TaxID=286306 RepID=A0AAW2H0H8_9HYME
MPIRSERDSDKGMRRNSKDYYTKHVHVLIIDKLLIKRCYAAKEREKKKKPCYETSSGTICAQHSIIIIVKNLF